MGDPVEMKVVVELAGFEDKAVVRRLMELYHYDFTEFLPLELNEHGEFGYRYLDHYWAADEIGRASCRERVCYPV